MFDSHTHLNDDALFANRQQHMEKFQTQGGKGLINVATDLERAHRAITITRKAEDSFPNLFVKSTVGFHPSEVCFGNITSQNIDSYIQELKDFLGQYVTDIVAIGEAGIDLHYPGDPLIQLQQELFARQCEIARDFKLPIVIHSRDGYAETMEVLKNYPDLKIYFHCFGYDVAEMTELQNTFENIWFGFDGNITYPKAQNLRDALMICEKKNILLETDAPYLAPLPIRGSTNEPANIKIIYDYVSDLLDWHPEAMKKQIEENFWRLYS